MEATPIQMVITGVLLAIAIISIVSLLIQYHTYRYQAQIARIQEESLRLAIEINRDTREKVTEMKDEQAHVKEEIKGVVTEAIKPLINGHEPVTEGKS